MKKISVLFLLLIGVMMLAACNDGETYADQKKRETAAINAFIQKNKIKVISESQFYAQDSTTDVSQNEYVLFPTTGVYMQIIDKGCGRKIKDGETVNVLCRFDEYNLLTDSLQYSNNNLYYAAMVDKMSVRNTSGTFTASFDTGSSVMYLVNSSTSVPSGWLVPFTYVNIGRPKLESDKIAKVKLIVPSAQGTLQASASVYPCLYVLTFERGR